MVEPEGGFRDSMSLLREGMIGGWMIVLRCAIPVIIASRREFGQLCIFFTSVAGAAPITVRLTRNER